MALPLGSPILSVDISRDPAQDTKVVQSRFFNHALTLLLPNATTLPKTVAECFTDQLAYKLVKLPLYRLIERPFLQAFVKNGSVSVISLNTKLDTDDCVAITPTGWLNLHLTKETYQELGLEAQKQTHIQKCSDTHVVKINLLADYFKPGRKGYESTLWCLKDRLSLEFNFLISWDPHDERFCSSSVGSYFVGKCERVERLDIVCTSRVATSLPYPKMNPNLPCGEDGASCHFQDVFNWIGAVACDVDIFEDSSGYLNSMTPPEPNYNVPRSCVVKISGFISSRTALKVWTALRLHASSAHSECYPACMTMHGFSDSVAIDSATPHTFGVCGDNLLTLLALSKDVNWHFHASVS